MAKLEAALTREIAALPDPAWTAAYCEALTENLSSKADSMAEGAKFSVETIVNTALRYEAFRITSFRDSSVSPKRFFGFLDEQGKTAKWEVELKDVSTRISDVINGYASKTGATVRVTPKEIIVTHLAEGGAILLTTDFQNVETIHPVYGVGLDDFLKGFNYFPGLLEEVDAAFGTSLKRFANDRYAKERMTFTESVLGTAVMYYYEKILAEKMRAEEGLTSINDLPLDEQFIEASLVYNSGILFAPERTQMIKTFATADYLFEVSEKTAQRPVNPRPKLPILSRNGNDQLLASGQQPPKQNTSWSAVYHILQRYGAWVALAKFGDMFDPSGRITPNKK
jgi:hypothetical protein